MTETSGRLCPVCGAARAADHSPSCDCGARASDALRAARTAEAAAAEDFDPLRIRPYVGTPERGAGSGAAGGTPYGGTGGTGGTHGDGGTGAQVILGRERTPGTLTGGPQGQGPAPTPTPTPTPTAGVPAPEHPAEVTTRLRPVRAPAGADVRLFDRLPADGAPPHPRTDGPPPGGRGRRRRPRRRALLSAAGAGAAVMAAAGVASGLFSYHTPTRDRAAQELRESVPDAATPDTASGATASVPGSAGGTGTGTRTVAERPRATESAPTASPTATASATTSPSPTVSTSAPERTPRPPAGTATATTDTVTAPASPPNLAPDTATVLSRGSQGDQVSQLQVRLRQLYVYTGRIDGYYSRSLERAVRTYQWARGLTTDPYGVYGPTTRQALEAETTLRW
ncbi:peptidoglycan-binding protein [Streptomyces sp. J2-1]|uniref:peptidoglycan-binding domain-containing protein n=1 Tax=Streptomyces corallincola TaxID=2851888 RepID=UPI001C385AD5|nr:peptidoglycan-binding domain-containing protein [Streptomyces corallincola]MBV2353752.1 peptidoglycan-binding protein [Streptomyces corallincola]